jgi:hypothetical protein
MGIRSEINSPPPHEASEAPENKINNNHLTISTAEKFGTIIGAVYSPIRKLVDRDGATYVYSSTGIRMASLRNQHLNATASHVLVPYHLKSTHENT